MHARAPSDADRRGLVSGLFGRSLAGAVDGITDRTGCFGLLTGHYVTVEAECDCDVVVSQPFLDHVGGAPRFKASVAAVWRRPCGDSCATPAFLHAFSKA